MPFTLDIEPPPDDVLQRATALAREVNLAEGTWTRPVGELGPPARVRLRFGRALALDPAILLLEHPTAEVPRSDVQALGREVRAIAERRGAAILIATADEEFATHVAARVLTLDAATGTLAERRRAWWRRA
jgi:ABC-type branched-subunit amino acid transport system ATPase component